MTAIELLLHRNSYAKLQEPAPVGTSRDRIFQSALRAPDHAMLKPWRFLVVEGDQRNALGSGMADVLQRIKPDATETELKKVKSNPLRAPLVIVAICATKAGTKVPKVEQMLSAGCAVQQMLLAAEAEGFGGMWRTGFLTYEVEIKNLLKVDSFEEIVGFLYIGTPANRKKELPALETSDYFIQWRP